MAPMTSAKVLLVDDEPAVLRFVAAMLGRAGFSNVETARDMNGAVEAWDHQAGGFDLIVCDYSLPEGSAIPFLQKAAQQKPIVKIIVMSGYSRDDLQAMEGAWDDRFALLQKPFTPVELTELCGASLVAR